MSEDAEYLRAAFLHVEARQDNTGATIVLVGEFDMSGTETSNGGCSTDRVGPGAGRA
jgi:hypothetical protein